MEGEIINFIRVLLISIASACYSYSLTRIFHIPKGIPRLIFILPVIYLFIVLPFSLSSFHLGAPTAFYLVWLGTFKLILYSFDLGPLCTHPNKSLLHFVSIALLPIKVKDEPRSYNNTATSRCESRLRGISGDLDVDSVNSTGSSKKAQIEGYPSQDSRINGCPDGQIDQGSRARFLFCVKLVGLAIVVRIYDYREELPSYVILANNCCHVYLGLEIALAVSAALVRAPLGLDMDPQFNEPYLATSLQDFWGRRWNLMVSSILRLSVYNPVRRVAAPLVGRRWAMTAGMLAAFTVSGLMHELIYFYLTHARPTWEVTAFFILHGLCTAAEVAVKEAVGGRFRLHRAVSGVLTIGFVGVTGVWLFLPQIFRNGVDVKAINEYPVMMDFVKQNVLRLARH